MTPAEIIIVFYFKPISFINAFNFNAIKISSNSRKYTFNVIYLK